MSLSVIFSDSKVIQSQQAMIRFLESKDVPRKVQAHELGVDVSYLNHIARGEKRFPVQDLMMRYMCSAYGDDSFLEEGAAGSKCVSPIPDVTFNGCTNDEILDGAEAIGLTRFDASKGDWRAVMQYGFDLISVGWRLVVHARHMLGHKVQPVTMTDAPLFHTNGR